jgi:hypothetical protein
VLTKPKTLSIISALALLGSHPILAASYSDTTGDGTLLGTWPHLDIASVEVNHTAMDLSFTINLVGNPIVVNWGQYNIGINRIPGGATSGTVPPNRPITVSSGMDYWIRSWDTGAETYHWQSSGSSWVMDHATWNPPSAIQTPVKTASSVTLTTTLASLGLAAGDTFAFDVYTSGGTGTDSAVDALANPLPTGASGNWVSPYDSAANVYQYTLTNPAPPQPPATGVGASLPYREYEAEDAVTTGTIIGPNRTFLTQASEASRRRAVSLNSTGQYVQFTLAEAANSIVVRFCIPDSSDGAGDTRTLSLYTNGVHAQDLTLTSAFSWVYGAYPYSNTPGHGSAHHFFDEVSALIGNLPGGTMVRLQKDAGDTASYYLIDLVDFEQVPAAGSLPANFLSIASYGATPNDSTDDTTAFKNAVTAAQSQGKGLWIPPGRFIVTNRVYISNLSICGAGMWHSLLQGTKLNLYGLGGTIQLSDFKLDGATTTRPANVTGSGATGIEGLYGNGSIISNVWVEHTVPGMWIDGPTTGLLITHCRMRNTFADGINLAYGVVNTRVEHCSVRNTGDDGMAMWSDSEYGTAPDQNNVFQNNTIQLPLLANGIGIYGGNNNAAVNNWIQDIVVNGAGVQVANRFAAFPFGGTTLIQGNQLDRCGSRSYDFATDVGALWLFAHDGDITAAINVTNNVFNDSTYQGIFLSGTSSSRSISNTIFANNSVNTAGSYGFQVNTRGGGLFRSTAFSNTTANAFFVNNANYLVTYALSSPPTSPKPYALGNVANFNWPPVIDWDGSGLSYRLRVGTTPGASNVLNAIVTSTNAAATNVIGNTLYASVSVINNGNLEGPVSASSAGVILLAPNGDQDGDGMSNSAEDLAGTSLFDADSVLRITDFENGNLLTWSSVSNRTYQVEATTNLATGFNAISGALTASGPSTSFTDNAATNATKYYRIKLIP